MQPTFAKLCMNSLDIHDTFLSGGSTSPKRFALLVGNTYNAVGKCNLRKLQGCKKSAEDIQQALVVKGFSCELVSDVSSEELVKKVIEFTERTRNCGARLFYFSGHGGNESFQVQSGGKIIPNGRVEFTGNNGVLMEGGDYVFGEDGTKVFKDQILNKITFDNQKEIPKILIFDCCRGNSVQEMGSSGQNKFRLKIARREEAGQENVHYKNVFILHSTLPHQVAWCEAGSSKFSTHFCEQLKEKDVDVDRLDEKINTELEKDLSTSQTTSGHIQMVEIIKRGVTKPFVF